MWQKHSWSNGYGIYTTESKAGCEARAAGSHFWYAYSWCTAISSSNKTYHYIDSLWLARDSLWLEKYEPGLPMAALHNSITQEWILSTTLCHRQYPLRKVRNRNLPMRQFFMVHRVKKGKQSKVHTSPSVGSDHVARLPGQVLKRNIYGE